MALILRTLRHIIPEYHLLSPEAVGRWLRLTFSRVTKSGELWLYDRAHGGLRISAFKEADYLAEQGVKLIITDHHEPGPELPAAAAVLNPKLNAAYPDPELAGVGVAFKLLHGLAQK